MGAKESRHTGIKTDNFGTEEYVDFKLDIWIITDANRKNFLKRLLGKNDPFEENIEFEKGIPHKINKEWIFRYFEKNSDKSMNHLLLKVLEEIKKNNNIDNKNVIIIFVKEINNKIIKEYLLEILKQNFKEHHQPFLLFISENENEITQDKIIDLLKESIEDYINSKEEINIDNDIEIDNNKVNEIENISNKKNEKDFDIEDYYMPYNMILFFSKKSLFG